MAKVIFGNHSAVRVSRLERENIRKFYCDVLGATITRNFDDKDDVRIGDDFFISFLYGAGDGRGADKGVNYASKDFLRHEDFMKAIFLELKADNVEEVRRKIVAFGVRVLEVPDPHLYFQAP